MNRTTSIDIRILAIDPTTKGFGYAVLEGPDRLVDWGAKTVRPNTPANCLRKVAELIDLYQPTVVVLENCAVSGSRRCPRVRRLIERIRALGAANGVKTRLVSRAQVRHAFAPACTKQEIAAAVAVRFPDLVPFLPPPRKPWMSEDYRMHIFDAVALAVAFLHAKIARQLARTLPTGAPPSRTP